MPKTKKLNVGDRVKIDWSKTPYVGTHLYDNEGTIESVSMNESERKWRGDIKVAGFCDWDRSYHLIFNPEELEQA